MISAAIRDQQALDCLEVSDRHRASLLAVARRLTGNEKEGEELLHRVLLNCHDAIQRNGFAGGGGATSFICWPRSRMSTTGNRATSCGAGAAPSGFRLRRYGAY